jgi:sterol 3beta-glucosyltransferase
MRITVNTFGTRGDVQPYIALGLGLQRDGHTVRIVTHRIFREFVEQFGLTVHSLDLDPRQVLLNQALSELGNNPLRVTRWMERNFAQALRGIFETTLAASRDAELMVNSALSIAGWHVAEKLGIPAVAAYLWPATPTRYLPSATGQIPPPWFPIKGPVNYLSTKLSNQLFFRLLSPLVNQCRDEILGLRPMKASEYWSLDSPNSPTPLIYGFSAAVIPKPRDWGPNQQVSGYWFLDTVERYVPEPSLADFLGDGQPPVCVGFGSMVEHEKEAITQVVVDALEAAGQRGVLLGGWSELGAGTVTDSVFAIDAVPHDWLFPRVAAAVHHGGAGTTAAALRDGLPSVIVPSFGDQFFWGWRVHELGVGSLPIPRKNLTSAKLAQAIRQVVHNEGIRRRASLLSRRIRSEDGVGSAVALIAAFARSGHF